MCIAALFIIAPNRNQLSFTHLYPYVEYSRSRIQLGNKKDRPPLKPTAWVNLKNTERKKPYTCVCLHVYDVQKRATLIYSDRSQNTGYWKERGDTRELSGVTQISYVLFEALVAQVYGFVKIH